MLRRDRHITVQIQQVLDAGLFGLSFWFAWKLRSDPDIIKQLDLIEVHSFSNYFYLYLVVIIVGPLVLEGQGYYDRPLVAPRRQAFWKLFQGVLITTVALILSFYLLRVELARTIAILFGIISVILIYVKDELLRMILRSSYARSQLQRRFILVGTSKETEEIRREFKTSPDDNIVIVGELDLNESSMEELVRMVHDYSLNGVILNARHNYFEKVEDAIEACEKEGVEVWLLADFFRTSISRTSLDELNGRPVLVFRTAPEASWQSVLKHVLDFTVALVALLILSPLLALVALLIKLGSPGPVFFRQQRSGLNGQPFIIFKFRTMGVDAESRKHELSSRNEMSGPVFKVTNDPRVTPIGRFLRKYSIDEFPQLFNILRGEMSIVGPRPLPVDEVKRFDDYSHRRRLSIKPGLTCLWQISGRSEVTDFKEWVRLDLQYIDNWSLWLDLKIIWFTIPVVLTGKGAK